MNLVPPSSTRFRRLRRFRRTSGRLDLEPLVHIESLLSVQTLHKLSRSLPNRPRNIRCIDFDRPALTTSAAVLVTQCDVVRVHFNSSLVGCEYSPGKRPISLEAALTSNQ